MSAGKLQTSKEWNENSPDLVYHQLAPALFDVLWFETDPAVFTLLNVPVCYICHHFAMNIIMVQRWWYGIVKSLADGIIGGLLSKPPIRQNKFPAKFSGHTVL